MLEPELDAIMCAIRHIRSGCTTLHCIQGGNNLDAEFVKNKIEGYEKVGIRLAYSSGVRDLNCITKKQDTSVKLFDSTWLHLAAAVNFALSEGVSLI